MQAPQRSLYPILFTDPPLPSWQTWRMSDSPFDRDLVREKMKQLKVTQRDLADDMGLNQSAISGILKGIRQVKVDEASKIYLRLGIERQPDVRLVPIIGLASAGNWKEAILHSGGVQPVPRSVAGVRSFAVEIKGDSMDKIIPEGGFAIVDPDQTQLYNDKVYLIENGEHDSQVKLYRSNPARFEPASTNELYQTLFMGEVHIRVIGRVVWQGSPL
jgi:repressor LexA